MAAEERDNKIIEVYKKNKFPTQKQIVEETGITRQSVGRANTSLTIEGKLIHNGELDLYTLPENKSDLNDKIDSYLMNHIESPESFQVCLDHMNSLRPILDRWRTEISKRDLSEKDSFSPRNSIWIPSYPVSVPEIEFAFNFETDWKFKHLSSHFPDLMKKWDNFQVELSQHYMRGNKLIQKLTSRIVSDLRADFDYCENGYTVNNLYSMKLLRFLKELALDEKKEPKGKGEQLYEKFQKTRGFITSNPSRPFSFGIILGPGNNIVENRPEKGANAYYVVQVPEIDDERQSIYHEKFCSFIELPKNFGFEDYKVCNEHRSTLDKYRITLMDELKDRNSPYMKEIVQFNDKYDRLCSLRTDLERDIDIYCNYSILPNICDILKDELKILITYKNKNKKKKSK